MLTQKELKEQLSYDHETGIFHRKTALAKSVKPGEIAGSFNNRGYVVIKVLGKAYKAHRLAWLYMEGYFPEHGVDHINGNPNDNYFANLRQANQKCNMHNARMNKRNSSGIKGISFASAYGNRNNPWHAYIGVDKKTINLGFFPSKKEAAKARHAAEIKYNFSNCARESSAKNFIEQH